MLTREQVIFLCVVAGFIPYVVKLRRIRGGYVLEIQALFWLVRYTKQQWIIRIPLIERLRRMIWTIITHLCEDDDNHTQE